MSNLATMIMEGSNYGFGRANLTHSYGHEDGAGLIAMESAEALRDIFEAEFYVPNTCTIAAALEGASCVEESSQAAIMEASVKGVFQKIKDFFIKLKEKVKDLLHNIIRYLKSIFMSDAKWVEQYKDELKALKSADLKGYEVKMYKYTIEEAMSKDAFATKATQLLDEAKQEINKQYKKNLGFGATNDEVDSDTIDEMYDKLYLEFIETELGKKVDSDEVQKELWSKFRNGADGESDKDDVAVGSNINKFIETITKLPKMLDAYNTAITKNDKIYKDAIKLVDDVEKKVSDAKLDTKNGQDQEAHSFKRNDEGEGIGPTSQVYGTQNQINNLTSTLRRYSSCLSKMQTFKNSEFNAAKAAITERSGAYKKALVGAFGYARKNKNK